MSAVLTVVKPLYEKKVNFIGVLVTDPLEKDFISRFGINTIPVSYFYDSTGKPDSQQIGVIEKARLMEILDRLSG